MKKNIFILFLFFSVLGVNAQFNKSQLNKLREADDRFELTDYYGAKLIYLELIKIDSLNPEIHYKLGICQYYLHDDISEAIYHLEIAKTGAHLDAYYYLGLCDHRSELFDQAIKNFTYFKEHDNGEDIPIEEVDRQIDIALRAQELIKVPFGYDIINLGKEINTSYHDYVPLVSANDSLMVFTSRREGSTGGEKDPYGKYFEDIYFSIKEHGQWQQSKNIGPPLNTATHDACVGLSHDGKKMIIFRTNEDLTGGDLYTTEFINGTWSDPKMLSKTINSDYAETSASITSDGMTIYFSSNRPGGYGGKDIYKSILFGNGEWSTPINLGPTINTKYDDDAPFISPDDRTLYFSSKGHKTIGGYDIFKSTMDENNKWTVPENIGCPINTVEDDIYFVITSNDDIAYYSSSKKGGFGGQDIYQINMIDRFNLIAVVKGVVIDSHSNPIKAKITLIESETGLVKGVYRSNENTGKFLIACSPNVSYKLIIEAKQFQNLEDELFFEFEKNLEEVNKSYQLIPNK
jgi:Tol biopolymer transport system component